MFIKADFTEPFQRVEALSVLTKTDDKRIRAVAYKEWTEAVYGGTQLMNRVLPEDSVVGSWDAGVIGYFSRFPVVNLDGLVNSYDYFHARNRARDGFYREFGITHFAEPKSFEGSLPNIRNRWELQLWPSGLPADENTVTGTWQRIEPHFDHQSADSGLIVDGRLALAFVRDCAPNELTVLSWVGLGEETVANDWTQTGPCVGAFVLPHDARPPVRVETMSMGDYMARGDYLARLLGDRRPVIRSDWDVYLTENSLVYVKEPCASADTEAMFFLHLHPVDANDLPGRRGNPASTTWTSISASAAGYSTGSVMATATLPEYAITRIGTGQFVTVEGGFHNLWEAGFDVVGPADDGQAAP